MTHDELLERINELKLDVGDSGINEEHKASYALRAVVELSNKQLDTANMPAEQVGWFHEGYNLAMDNIIDVIEKELG